jgi:hypothetical protein
MYDYIFVDTDGRTIVPFWWQFHPSQIMDFYDFFDTDSLVDALQDDPQMRTQIGTAVVNTILYHLDHNNNLLKMNRDERRLFNILKQYSDKSWIDLEKKKIAGAKGGKAKNSDDE